MSKNNLPRDLRDRITAHNANHDWLEKQIKQFQTNWKKVKKQPNSRQKLMDMATLKKQGLELLGRIRFHCRDLGDLLNLLDQDDGE